MLLVQNKKSGYVAQVISGFIGQKGRNKGKLIITINDGSHDITFPARFLYKYWTVIS